MMTVNEVSKRTGVSIRTLQYYDKIGLLRPAGRTEAGYRLYDDAALERLQQILLFRELEFPLKDVRKIVENPVFDRQKALEQQITLLTLKKQHLENLIGLAQKIRSTGGNVMDFTAFDTQKIKKYAEQAKKEWGETPEYKEFEKKTAHKTTEEVKGMSGQHCSGIWWDAEQGPGRPGSADTGEKAAGVYHGALLHLLKSDPESVGADIWCGRCVYRKYQCRWWCRCRRICAESH